MYSDKIIFVLNIIQTKMPVQNEEEIGIISAAFPSPNYGLHDSVKQIILYIVYNLFFFYKIPIDYRHIKSKYYD